MHIWSLVKLWCDVQKWRSNRLNQVPAPFLQRDALLVYGTQGPKPALLRASILEAESAFWALRAAWGVSPTPYRGRRDHTRIFLPYNQILKPTYFFFSIVLTTYSYIFSFFSQSVSLSQTPTPLIYAITRSFSRAMERALSLHLYVCLLVMRARSRSLTLTVASSHSLRLSVSLSLAVSVSCLCQLF